MFFPNPNDITQALDAATGDLLWEYRRRVPEDVGEYLPAFPTNRNLAIYEDLILDNGDNVTYSARCAFRRACVGIVDTRLQSRRSKAPGRSLRMAKRFRA